MRTKGVLILVTMNHSLRPVVLVEVDEARDESAQLPEAGETFTHVADSDLERHFQQPADLSGNLHGITGQGGQGDGDQGCLGG